MASHISGIAPYELPQVIAQIPPPPMDVPMPFRKALMIDGENKVVNYLLHGEYDLNKTSWCKLQKKYNVSKNKVYAALKGKGRPRGSQYHQKKKQIIKSEAIMSHSDTQNDYNFNVFNYLFILGIPNTMPLLMLLGYLMCNVLLAWATLQQPYVSKTLTSPLPQNKNNWVH